MFSNSLKKIAISSFSSISVGNSSLRVVVPSLISSGKSSSFRLLSIPIPTTTQSISLKVALTSVKTPDILSPWIKTSFGHLILASRPKDLIDLAIATPVANVINPILAGGTLGLKIRDIHIPPSGDSHFLPNLPLAFVWISEIIAVPSSALWLAKNLAIEFVENTFLKQRISLPISSVSKVLEIFSFVMCSVFPNPNSLIDSSMVSSLIKSKRLASSSVSTLWLSKSFIISFFIIIT